MKTSLILAFSAVFAVGAASADVPRKPSNASYAHLWNSSPFTSKPPPPPPGEQVGAFDDWALGGVSEVEGGYMVTLQHKKNAGERQVILPTLTMKHFPDRTEQFAPGASGSFKVDRVEFGKTSWMDTVVHLSAGGRTGSVKFDEKSTTPKGGAAPPQKPGQQPNAQQQGQPNPQLQAIQQQQGQQQQPQPPRVNRPRIPQPAPRR
jgi:hypothetical protein